MPLEQLPSISQAQELMSAGKLSPIELVEFCLTNIERRDPQLHAWVVVDADAARRVAATQARRLATASGDLGPLFGIPIGVKDIIDLKGFPTRAGAKWRATSVATANAEIVDSLERAGAIVLGKTVTTELACFDPSPTRNPRNLTHTPGGSSSGSAAAVASEMCMAALGSQTGGSITRPATYCGISGWKPSYREFALSGVVPVSFHLDHVGILARTASDLLAFRRPFGYPDSEPTNRSDYSIGVIRDYFFSTADPLVAAQVDSAIETWRDTGIQCIEMPLCDGFETVHHWHRTLMAAELAAAHGTCFAEHGDEMGPAVRKLFEEGLTVSTADYSNALRHRQKMRVAFAAQVQNVDAIIVPAAPTVAPDDLTTTGDPRFNSPWSFIGAPTVSIPIGTAEHSMPCGVQIVGGPSSDCELLALAAKLEEVLAFSL